MRTQDQMDEYRQRMLEAGFALFSVRPIESVLMPEVAKAAGVGRATLYRYYNNKTDLAVAVAAWKMQEFYREISASYVDERIKDKNAAQCFVFYIDTFLELYRSHQDILRFNQFFNTYMLGLDTPSQQISPFLKAFSVIADRFHENVYELAKQDGTVRTDIPEAEMFTAIVHIMMAAVTRYALGLVYCPAGCLDPEAELLLLKQMLLRQYCIG